MTTTTQNNAATQHNDTFTITPDILKTHRIKTEEYDKILSLLNRQPNLVELGIFSAMWSEHCSYKSTRIHLKHMHTTGPQVICGPGENAGIIDGLDNDAIIFKMESHNHPSYIEPFNGSATGVGGILRDVFTMGARPIANVNSLRFGTPNSKKMQQLIKGVNHGISFYGNCVGVPMLAGQTTFDPSYDGNILVNAMAVGLASKDKIFYSGASDEGLSVIYFGSKTGRDGIHGAAMSSVEFSTTSQSQRSTVQVGDPFYEKLLIEACLELMASNVVISIQDMGAAGLTCSSAEMASKGNKGIELWLDQVPQRETNMQAYEIMLSESQERMLMTIKPDKEQQAFEILKKWELDYAKIGIITNTDHLVIKMHNQIQAEIPIKYLTDEAPIYTRPHLTINDDIQTITTPYTPDSQISHTLLTILADPNISSKEQIWQKYDRGVQGKVIESCGQESGIVSFGTSYTLTPTNEAEDKNYILSQIAQSRVNAGGCSTINFLAANDLQPAKSYTTSKALAITCTCNPFYTASNAKQGAIQAVAEAYANLSATGATPSAITNCLNFGNPEKPEIMGQIVDSIQGITHAAKTLNFPVVSGNVSLYNETNGTGIKPTPAIGAVGIVQDLYQTTTRQFKQEGDLIFLIGSTTGHLTNTAYARIIERKNGGQPPFANLTDLKTNADFIRNAINKHTINAATTISNGGILTALAKMSLYSQNALGFDIQIQTSMPLTQFLFAEDQSRFLITVSKEHSTTFIQQSIDAGIITTFLGHVTQNSLTLNNQPLCTHTQLSQAFNTPII